MQYKHKAVVLALVLLGVAALLPLTASATTWNAPIALGTGIPRWSNVAIDSTAKLHYVFTSTSQQIIYSKCNASNTCGTTQVALPTVGSSSYPSIAIDANDRPNVVFGSKTGDAAGYGVYFTMFNGTSWTAPVRLSTEAYAQLPVIAIDRATGTIHVVYTSTTLATVYYVKSTNGGVTWSTPALLVQGDQQAPVHAPGGAVDPAAPLDSQPMPSANVLAPNGQLLNAGLYPRIALDPAGHLYVTYQNQGYVFYKYQTATGWKKILVSGGHKDQTPDIAIDANGAVAIVWGRYDTFQSSFALFKNDVLVSRQDAFGGLFYSLWPRVSADCSNNFHIAYQGQVSGTPWDIYYQEWDATNNKMIGFMNVTNTANYGEQTPAIATNGVAGLLYFNTTVGIVDATTANLGLSCSPSTTPTPTVTGTVTVTETLTPTATPTTGNFTHIPNKDPRIVYSGTGPWSNYPDTNATDGNYRRCGTGASACIGGSMAALTFTGSQVVWETAYAWAYGQVIVKLDGVIVDRVDLCAPNPGNYVPVFAKRTYKVTGDPTQQHTIKVKGLGTHTSCSIDEANYFVIDGFDVYP